MKFIYFLSLCTLISAHFQEYHHRVLSLKSSNVTTVDVLIIGAGISGLEAARLLQQNGIKTLILEGRNRTGGRIWSIKSKNGATFDMGAGWIHGIDGSIPSGHLTNPLWDLTRKAKIVTRSTKQEDFQSFFSSNDNNCDVHSWYDEYMDFVREETRMTSTNLSLRYYANLFIKKKNFNEKEKLIFFSYLYYTIENNEATELDEINAKLFLDFTSIHYGEEHIFHQTGFMALTDYLAADLQKQIQLEQIVMKINYNEQFVQVSTTNGLLYQSQFVLITVPLGVLKSKQIQFLPSLPQWKTDVIQRLGFGLFEKVILLWDRPWWNSTNYYFLRISSKPSEFAYWVNANKWNDKPALICFFTGKTAKLLESNKNEIIKQIIQSLEQMFPYIVIPLPIQTYITHWNKDPFSYGSYSYTSVHQKSEDRSYLAEPVANRLLFAGEATSIDSYGYAHGALLSARREVTRLLYVYNLLSNQNSII